MNSAILAPVFRDVVGHGPALRLLQAALERQRLAPAYLFSGPEGIGRRLAALRFIEALLGEERRTGAGLAGDGVLRRRLAAGNHPDVLLVEPTYSEKEHLVPVSEARAEGLRKKTLPLLRLEQIRRLSAFLAGRPVEARRVIVLIDGAEAMNEAAANALLKTLEEPGGGLLILLTTSPRRLLQTIVSRCHGVPFRPLTPQTMAQVLERLASAGAGSEAEAEAPLAPDPAPLLHLAAGSPGALLEHRRQWRELPEGLAAALETPPSGPRGALALARRISDELELDQQLWLLAWWQQQQWLAGDGSPAAASLVRRLDQLRLQLQGFVQPRLAWEVALLELNQQS